MCMNMPLILIRRPKKSVNSSTKIAYEYMDIILSKTKDDYENLNRKNLPKAKEVADDNIHGASMTCRKCGHTGFDYDQYWKEGTTCKNCGWQGK